MSRVPICVLRASVHLYHRCLPQGRILTAHVTCKYGFGFGLCVGFGFGFGSGSAFDHNSGTMSDNVGIRSVRGVLNVVPWSADQAV